ncbi:MAG: flagellar hook-associated protein FlgL [Rhodoferax sp.]
MQISTHYLFDRATAQMSTLQNELSKTQAQIAAKKQVLNPSDAPNQAAAIARLKSVIARQDNYSTTLDAVQMRLSLEDSTLKSASDILVRIKEIAVQANNASLSSSNRQALGTELKGLRDQLLSLSNSRDINGNYIFAGSRVGQAAFATDADGSVVYQGDQTQMQVAVGERRSVAINRPGTHAFARVVRSDSSGTSTGVGFFQSLDDMVAAVNGQTADGTSLDPTIAAANRQRSLGEADSLLQGMVLAQASVGSDMKVVEQQGSILQDTTLSLKTALSNIEDLDYASAITQMNKQMLSLEAAQSSFAKISQNSLFNYLK